MLTKRRWGLFTAHRIVSSLAMLAIVSVACAWVLTLPSTIRAGAAADRVESLPTTVYRVKGLEKPVEILVDPWGVPHIYANTLYDVFFAQGFNAARDRLWQIDLWRRRGLGQLSEVFGPAFVEQDRAARLFLYRGDMYREWLAYGSDAKRIATAFVNGINAYVKMVRENPELLPLEFRILGYEPAYWSPEDVVRIRSHGLTRNVRSEVARARIICRFGHEVEAIRSYVEPRWQITAPTVPEGLDPCEIPDDVLRVYDLAVSEARFSKEKLQLQIGGVETEEPTSLALAVNEPLEGSNNWAISPHLTATGRPILGACLSKNLPGPGFPTSGSNVSPRPRV